MFGTMASGASQSSGLAPLDICLEELKPRELVECIGGYGTLRLWSI